MRASRSHFFAAAANSMRQIHVNWALARRVKKRGGESRQFELDDLTAADGCEPDLILDLDKSRTSAYESWQFARTWFSARNL